MSTGTTTGTMQAAGSTSTTATTSTTGAAGMTTSTTSSAGSSSANSAGSAGSTTANTMTTTGAAGMAATSAAGMGAAGATAAAGTGTAAMPAAGMGAAGDAAGAASSEPTFTRVHEEVLVGTGCAAPGACHGNAQGPSKLGFTDKMEAYMTLVGVKAMGMPLPGDMSEACNGMDIERVKAGDPDNSLLMQKLENKQMCGAQMPPGGMIKPDQIQLVRDWIMAGAKDD